MMRMQTALFCQATDVSTATRGGASSWRAAGKFVEDAQIPWRSSAAVPQQPPVPASGPQLTLSPGFTSQCSSLSSFAPRWKPFPSDRLLVFQGVSPVAVLPSVPLPPAQSRGRDGLPEHFQGSGFPSYHC